MLLCINRFCYFSITEGRTYKILYENSRHYFIYNNRGNKIGYQKDLFIKCGPSDSLLWKLLVYDKFACRNT